MNESEIPGAERVDPEERAELLDLLSRNLAEDELYAMLGGGLGPAASGEPPEETGRNVFRRRLAELQRVVCGSATLRNLCSNPNYSDSTTLAIAVLETLKNAEFLGLSLPLVSALIVRTGLRNLCRQEWT